MTKSKAWKGQRDGEFETSYDLNGYQNGNELGSTDSLSSHGDRKDKDNEQLSSSRTKGIMDKFEYLIPFLITVQTVFRKMGVNADLLKLPRIVVVGLQSAGKSSVLESIVGKAFLPRGTGTVTRCPIVINLIHTNLEKEEWCVFAHNPDVKLTNSADIQKEIIDQTTRIAGKNCGITKEVISLSFYSPNVVDLTLIDLPGMVKNPKGDQPEDIEIQIHNLIMEYIKPENSIILAVSSASNDIETSESLKLAREVDPTGARTLAVMTKIDEAASLEYLTEVLKGKVISVKLGIIGVMNRSQKDIDGNKSIHESLEKERDYLVLKFPGIASLHGTPYLTNRLHRILMQQVDDNFPFIDKKLKELETQYRQTLEELGSPVDLHQDEKREHMINAISNFVTSYRGQIEGRSRNMDVTSAAGAAKLDYIFQDIFRVALQKIATFDGTDDETILFATRNSQQVGARLTIPEDAFRHLAREEILRMRQPMIDCANLVYDEMIETVSKCLDVGANRFPKINRSICQVMNDILHERTQECKRDLEKYIMIHSSCAITAQDEFYDKMEELTNEIKVTKVGRLPPKSLAKKFGTAITNFMKTKAKKFQPDTSKSEVPTEVNGEAGASNNEGDAAVGDETSSGRSNSSKPNSDGNDFNADQRKVCSVVRQLMDLYFKLAMDQCQDFTPKCVLHSLVFQTIDNLDKVLIKKLTTPEKVTELVKESESISAVRETVQNDLKALEEACNVLEQVRRKTEF